MDNKIKPYDLMVVYSETIANSAKDEHYKEKSPFSSKGDYESYNESYNYFLMKCKERGIKVAFTTSKDIIGSGIFQSFWVYNKKWVRKYGKAYSKIIFDKFTPENIKQKNKLKLLTSSKSVHMFNNKKIINLFQNKLNTSKHFKKFTIPTVEIINHSKQKIVSAKNKLDKLLKNHKHKFDFNNGYLIKDKIGAGGFKIYKVDFDKKGIKEIMKCYKPDINNKFLSYILQPFINCKNSFVFGKHKGLLDLRLIILNNKIIQTYIRIAKKGKFKCNIHQGGNLFYVSKKAIPQDVLKMSKKIIKKLETKLNLKHTIYALDFVRSNKGNLYFIEGNTNPGIIWEDKNKKDETKSKELISIIVNELKCLIKEKKTI